MNPFTPWWLAWGAAFLAIEGTAIRVRNRTPGGTLSSLVWRFSSKEHRVRRLVFLAGWAVLSGHFVFHWL